MKKKKLDEANGRKIPEAFARYDLSAPVLNAVADMGFEEPSPIQAAFLPLALTGTDATGQARTGTGKTAAFSIPILEKIDHDSEHVQAIVLTPTRELSTQVGEEFDRLASYLPARSVVIVGGRRMGQQIDRLKAGAQVVIGTPGRVIDLMNRGHLDLSKVQVAVLDEADRMLDIGFRPDIEKILRRCPRERQTLLLSATMPPEVERLAASFMTDPQRVDLSEDGIAVDTIEQWYVTVDHDKKFRLLVKLLKEQKPKQVLVFTRTKRGADKLYEKFRGKLNHVSLLHGDLHQRKRDKVMQQFRDGEFRMMIATDVVGRGIDVSGISHIVNYDVPEDCDDYVHRVGRTGRLSSDEAGKAFTFVTKEQGNELTRIELRINNVLPEYKFGNFDAYIPRPEPKPVVTIETDGTSEWEEVELSGS